MMGTREAPSRPERICILRHHISGVKTPFLHPKSALTPPEGTAAERRGGNVGFARAEWAGRLRIPSPAGFPQ